MNGHTWLVRRVIAWLQAHDGEVLLTGDIAVKFAHSAMRVPMTLAPAVRRDWLKRERAAPSGGRGKQSTYSLGPAAPLFEDDDPTHPLAKPQMNEAPGAAQRQGLDSGAAGDVNPSQCPAIPARIRVHTSNGAQDNPS